MTEARSDALTFLQYLFEYKDPRQYFLIWDTPTKTAKFFREPAEAVAHIDAIKADHNVYYGVGLHARVPPFGRGGAEAVVGIPALWADIDVEDAAHQKNLPPTVKAAMEVLDQLPWRPSVMIHSGHGLQPAGGSPRSSPSRTRSTA